MTTAKEAIERLDDMQSQIIHGKRTFGDIADVIRDLVKRDEQWNEKWKLAVETNGSSCGEILKLQSPTTPNAKLPPLGEGPRRKMIIEIEVTEDFEERLDNQWMVEREIHADRWNWRWASGLNAALCDGTPKGTKCTTE